MPGVWRVSRGGRVTSTEVVSAFSLLESTLIEMLLLGKRVETPLGTFSLSIGSVRRDEFGHLELTSTNARVTFRPRTSLLDAVRKEIAFLPEIAKVECESCKECFPLCPTSWAQAAYVLMNSMSTR